MLLQLWLSRIDPLSDYVIRGHDLVAAERVQPIQRCCMQLEAVHM